MAATFLNPAPQPGDGARLLQQSKHKRGRGRKKIQSFLLPSHGDGDEVEAGMHGPKHDETLLQPSHENGKERTSSLLAPDSNFENVPRIIRNETLLSSHQAKSPPVTQPQLISFLLPPFESTYTLAQDSNPSRLQHHLADAEMALPPHLRIKKVPKQSAGSGRLKNTEWNGSAEAAASTKTEEDHTAVPAGPSEPNGADIRQKLHDHHHVKVSDPKPIKSAMPALVSYPSSNEEEQNGVVNVVPPKAANGEPQAPLTKSSKAERSTGHAHDQQPKRGDTHGQRGGRGIVRGGRRTRNSRWPTAAEIRPDPHRWDIKWDDDSSSNSDIDSAVADSGFGDGKKKRKHVDGIDSETGFQLADWDGNFAPAPTDWDARPAFRNTISAEKIEQWMNKIEEDLWGKDWGISLDELTKSSEETVGEIAPRYWTPVVIGEKAPQTFWNELVKSTEPKPLDEGDLDRAKPWWERYHARGGNFLKPCEHPAIKGIDPDETREERLARENDSGSRWHAENRKKTEKAKRDAERDKRKRAQERARKISDGSGRIQSREVIKPDINLYIRSAKPVDVPRIREIYNHYVDNSACTPETERRTNGDIQQRLNDIVANKLPFLVACERGKILKGRAKKNQEDVVLPDKVVGFATADDYNDMRGMYRFTAEIETFVDKDYYMKCVAKCLLDKLMALLDPNYIERGGYDIEGEELEGAGVGASRIIKNIIVHIPYDNQDRLDWIERWLSNWLDFKKVGNLPKVGNKAGKSVHLAIFQRTTGASVNAAQPPIMMEYPS